MLYAVYLDNEYVGNVIAADDADALLRARDKFGPMWGILEVRPRSQKRVTDSRLSFNG